MQVGRDAALRRPRKAFNLRIEIRGRRSALSITHKVVQLVSDCASEGEIVETLEAAPQGDRTGEAVAFSAEETAKPRNPFDRFIHARGLDGHAFAWMNRAVKNLPFCLTQYPNTRLVRRKTTLPTQSQNAPSHDQIKRQRAAQA